LRHADISGGATSSRLGNSSVGATRGLPFSASDSVVLPDVANAGTLTGTTWDLSAIYVYAASGDVLSISVAF
jgi:hypothetical protein